MEDKYEMFSVSLGEEEIEFDKDHAALYTFLGSNALYDHCFLVMDEEGEEEGTIEECGLYIFRTANEKFYNECAEFLTKQKYPLHLNLPDISSMDVRMWEHVHLSDLTDFPPEEWLDM